MKNTMLIIAGIIIIVLLLLLYFNFKDNRQVQIDRMTERILYEDSLKRHEKVQDSIKIELAKANTAKDSIMRTHVVTKNQYKRKIKRLEHQVAVAHTPKVDSLIKSEPELKSFVGALEVVVASQALRIDSLEIEKRIEHDMYDYINAKQSSLAAAQAGENQFLRNEVDKRDQDIAKLEKKLKRARRLAAFLGLLNLAPRGGNY